MKTIVVTGGLGYLGGRICDAVEQQGDWRLRLTTRRNEQKVAWLKSTRIIQFDLSDATVPREVVDGVDCIVHLAACSAADSATDPVTMAQVNAIGTRNLLRSAIASGVRRFIYLSTAHVYGLPLAGEITEETPPRPVHPYATSNLEAEGHVLAARAGGQIEGVVVRLSNAFGRPMSVDAGRWALLGNDICRQAVTDRRMVLRSPGLQWCDFVPVTDVARAILHLASVAPDYLADGLFNLGGDNALRVIDFAERAQKLAGQVLGFEPEILRPSPGKEDEQPRLHFRSEKLKKTGFRLETGFEDELKSLLGFCAEAFAQAPAQHARS